VLENSEVVAETLNTILGNIVALLLRHKNIFLGILKLFP